MAKGDPTPQSPAKKYGTNDDLEKGGAKVDPLDRDLKVESPDETTIMKRPEKWVDDGKTAQQGEACCGCENPLWNEWTPVCYRFPHGCSLNRGCFFAWFCVDAPFTCWHVGASKVHGCVNPRGDGNRSPFVIFLFYVLMYIILLPVMLVTMGLTVFGAVVALFAYLVTFLVEAVMMCFYFVSCGVCNCCCASSSNQAEWRTFNCRGWVQPEWTPGRDPYTDHLWEEWSPLADLCNYNCPRIKEV